MAIETRSNKDNSGQGPTTTVHEALSGANIQQPGTGPVRRTFSQMLTDQSRLMSGDSGSAQLAAMKKITDALLATVDNTNVVIKAIPIDNTSQTAYYSGLMIVVVRKEVESVLGYHYLMLAASRELPTAQQRTEQNVRFERHLVAGEMYDKILIATLMRVLRESFPNKNTIINTGCTTVPAHTDCNDEAAVRRLLSSAVNRCHTEIGIRTKQVSPITFDPTLIALDTLPEIGVNFTKFDANPNSGLFDATGAPIRNDVNIMAILKAPVQQGHSHNSAPASMVISRVSAFVDVAYSRQANQALAQQALLAGGTVAPHCYTPTVIITHAGGDQGFTDETMLVGIDSALAMRDVWSRALQPTPAQIGSKQKNVIDGANVGALNVLANVPTAGREPTAYGQVLPVSDPSFTTSHLQRFFAAVFDPQGFFNVAVDCPQHGATNGGINTINDAALGVPAAVNRLLDCANYLTGGAFGKKFNAQTQKIFSLTEVVFAGTYTDAYQKKRDLRDIDLIWASAYYEKNPQDLVDYLKTFNAYADGSGRSLDMCLWARRRMVMGLTRETADITGMIYRHFLSGSFLMALRQSLAECGYNPTVSNNLSANDFANSVVSANFVSGGINIGLGSTPLFNTQRTPTNNNVGYGGSLATY